MSNMYEVTIYTDGACSGNPGAGGWGAILMCGNYSKQISGNETDTTNNRMELAAVINALLLLKTLEFILKLTRHNIHICAIAELNDDASDEFAEFIGDLGEIEFDVRMTTAEKFMLILSILFTLLNKTEMKAKENGIDKESNNIVEKLKKEYFCDEKTIMSTIKDLFTNIFNDDNIKG